MSIVIADLGASNARFAIIQRNRMSDIYQFACDDFKNPLEMIQSFVKMYAPDAGYFLAGVPAPVFSENIKWTNRPWKLNSKELKRKLKLKEVVLLNDLEVQGSGLKALTKKDLIFLQGTKTNNGPKILVNVGTGLGACYIVDGKVYSAEYGQTLISAGDILEDVVSGPGFKRLYQTVAGPKHPISATQITDKCLSGNRLAQKTYRLFYEDFSRTLMNLALIIKATGGVYFCGGVLDEKSLKQMHFANSFSNHPKMKGLLKSIPLVFIRKKDFAFLGLKELVKKFGWS